MAAFLEKRKPTSRTAERRSTSSSAPTSCRCWASRRTPRCCPSCATNGACRTRRPASSAACSSPAMSPPSRSGPRSPIGSMRAASTSPAPRSPPAASTGFGFAGSGFASAVFFQVLLGVGIAATYMPGLRLLSDRICGPYQSRYIAFYTSFFGIGTALSLALAGFIAPAFGWRAAFVLSALGPLLAGAMVFFLRALPAHGGRRVLGGTLFPGAPGCGCCRSRRRRLHARLHGALPRAFRLARLDGGVPCLLRQPARRGNFPVAGRRDRGRREPAGRAGIHLRQRGSVAHRAAALDPHRHGGLGRVRHAARLRPRPGTGRSCSGSSSPTRCW